MPQPVANIQISKASVTRTQGVPGVATGPSPANQERLLLAASRAPSGDNCQPWHFEFDSEGRFVIRVLPARAKSFFDFQNQATLLSVGCVIENVRTQAAFDGFDCEVERLGASHGNGPAAIIRFRPLSSPRPSASRRHAMLQRTVNRRPFRPFPGPSAKTLRGLLGPQTQGTHTDAIRSPLLRAKWARAIYLADLIRWSHPEIHSELFAKILWNKDLAESVRMGLEINRLGVGPAARPLLGGLRDWERMAAVARAGGHRMLAAQSWLLAMGSPAMVLVTVPREDPESFIRAGEEVERLWIVAKEQNLCVHPMCVALYLDARYRASGIKDFLPEHRPILEALRSLLSEIVPSGYGAMVFRLGHGWPMRTPAIRLPLDRFIDRQGSGAK